MTVSTRREDSENRQRPPVTSGEFADFLKYVDDLAVMRLRSDEAGRLVALLMVGGFLWAFGIGFRLIEFEFGLFYALCVGLTCVSMLWWKLRSACPRCEQRFGKPFTFIASPFGFSARLAPTSERCETCGLRALSQYDVSRFLRERFEAAQGPPAERSANEQSLTNTNGADP